MLNSEPKLWIIGVRKPTEKKRVKALVFSEYIVWLCKGFFDKHSSFDGPSVAPPFTEVGVLLLNLLKKFGAGDSSKLRTSSNSLMNVICFLFPCPFRSVFARTQEDG